MAVKKIPARDIIVQVHDGETPGTWVDIKGLTTATINPAENEEVVDATTFGSDGHYEQLVMQRGASITLEGFKLQDPDTGDLDPGQERCEELATETGVASLGSSASATRRTPSGRSGPRPPSAWVSRAAATTT